MRFGVLLIVILCSACANAPESGRTTSVPPSEVPPGDKESADAGLSALEAMTFSCPQAALNAAAREAAKVPAQGRYQFVYFRVVEATAHPSYEVHFRSNYHGEEDLKYAVSLYCQQGQDPDATASVTLIGNGPKKPK